jgi:hypothetical protein
VSERWRQRRLHVENRLAELNAKYGRLEDSEPWDETYFRRWLEPLVSDTADTGPSEPAVSRNPPGMRKSGQGLVPIWERPSW